MKRTDEDKIKYFGELGETKLPQRFRQQILTIFQKYPDKWFTPEMFAEGLDMGEAYARKVCEALVLARMVVRKGTQRRNYFKFLQQETEKSEESVGENQ